HSPPPALPPLPLPAALPIFAGACPPIGATVTILSTYEQRHPTSAELHEQATEIFPDGVTHDARHFTPFPIYVDHAQGGRKWDVEDRKSTRLNSSHVSISYAV